MAKHFASGAEPGANVEAQPKRRRHLILDHPVLTIFVTFADYIVLTIGFSLVALAALSEEDKEIMTSVVAIAITLLMLLLYQLHLRKEFDGVLHWSTMGLLFCSPALLFAGQNIVSNVRDGVAMGSIPLALLMAASPGIGEEILFRGIPGSNWLRARGEERDILPGAIATSLLFGIMHGSNIVAGAAISTTLFQVGYAFCLGLLFEAVLLRTGSLIPSIIMHTLVDFSAFLYMDPKQNGILTEAITLDANFVVVCAFSVFTVAFGLFLLRPSKRAEIVALWDRKCKRVA